MNKESGIPSTTLRWGGLGLVSHGGIFKRDLLPPAVAVGLRHRSLREVLDAAVVDGPGRAAADLERRPVPGACAIAREVSPHAGMRDNKKGGGTYRCMRRSRS